VVKHGGLIRRLFCVLVVVILNSREIPCVNKKRCFLLVFPDTAIKSGYTVKTWYVQKARARSPLGEKSALKSRGRVGFCRFVQLTGSAMLHENSLFVIARFCA
jgi:hypothetical protein